MAKATKPAELRAKTEDELNTILLDLKKEQFNLRFQRAVGQNEGASRVREVRREIARLKTVQHANKNPAVPAATKPAASAAAQS